ncbi:MAG: hypothetical protein K9K62_02590 [Desulfobacteraceae bacterium]|nr:hypothetical protein [Desulfobacteraceae bacterium]
MKARQQKSLLLILAVAAIFLLAGPALAQDGCGGNGTGPAVGPAQPGPHGICSYTDGVGDSDYKNAEMFYPCDIAEEGEQQVAATTVSAGWTGNKDMMDWISEHLATHGYVVLAITPNHPFGFNKTWKKAHLAGIEKIKAENDNAGSPISGLVDTNKLQVMGFSKGGGGTLLASAELGDEVASTIALAPFFDGNYSLEGIDSPTQLQTGTNDSIAPPDAVVEMFDNLPPVERLLAYFDGTGHLEYQNSGEHQDWFKTYITGWMKYYLDGDESYLDYIDGSQDWFYMFEYYPAGTGPGPGGGSSSCGYMFGSN